MIHHRRSAPSTLISALDRHLPVGLFFSISNLATSRLLGRNALLYNTVHETTKQQKNHEDPLMSAEPATKKHKGGGAEVSRGTAVKQLLRALLTDALRILARSSMQKGISLQDL
jgi:hypothetical protein